MKCPNLEKRLNSQDEDALKIFCEDRILDFKEVIDDLTNIIYPQIQESNYCGVEVKKRLDNTLKSFLTHSQKSFLVQMILILIY